MGFKLASAFQEIKSQTHAVYPMKMQEKHKHNFFYILEQLTAQLQTFQNASI